MNPLNGFFKMLGVLFPPKLPKLGRIELIEPPEEQGECGKAQQKQYRDAIERHWSMRGLEFTVWKDSIVKARKP